MNWNEYYIGLLEPISRKSKDPRTKVGAVIVDQEYGLISTGFNGFPKGVKDLPERYNDRPTKYKFIAHADTNAIDIAAKQGKATNHGIMYLPWYPCSNCTKSIINCGIKKVVIDGREYEEKEKHWTAWKEDIDISKIMMSEAGVELEIYKGE